MRELEILLGGRYAGTLTQDRNGAVRFKYELEYASDPDATPLSISMPLSVRERQGRVVLAWMSNLLPDNERVLQRWGHPWPCRRLVSGAQGPGYPDQKPQWRPPLARRLPARHRGDPRGKRCLPRCPGGRPLARITRNPSRGPGSGGGSHPTAVEASAAKVKAGTESRVSRDSTGPQSLIPQKAEGPDLHLDDGGRGLA